mgnify:CR=1 FL=1
MEETYRNSIQQDDQSDIRLSDIWNMIWGYKWWYVVSVAFCIMIALLYLYRTPATYSRTAKVVIDEDSQDATMRWRPFLHLTLCR